MDLTLPIKKLHCPLLWKGLVCHKAAEPYEETVFQFLGVSEKVLHFESQYYMDKKRCKYEYETFAFLNLKKD